MATEFRPEQLVVSTGSTDNNTVTTKGYTDDTIADSLGGVNFDYFFSDTAEGVIAGYDLMFPANTGESESTVVVSIPSADTLIQNFITETSEPTFLTLVSGVYDIHIHAAKTAGTKDVFIYAEFYKRASGGSETLLATTENSPLLAGSNTEYNLHFTIDDDETLLSDDRLVVKFYGTPSGVGTDPTATLYLEGNNASRVEVRTTSDALDGRYAVKSGLDGGQTLSGGAQANDDLLLDSTSNSTKGYVGIKSGTLLRSLTPNYEALVTIDDAIPNKKYVDDAVATENIWDRTGTDVTLKNAGDTVQFDATGGIQFGAGGQNIVEFSIDGTLIGDSNTALPTEKAVKTYVDALNHSALNNLTFNTAGHGVGFLGFQRGTTNSIAPPTVTDDSNSGYRPGDLWVDTAADTPYVCLDASPGAAIWKVIEHGSSDIWTRTGSDVTLTSSGDTVQFEATGGIQFGGAGQNIDEFSIDGTLVGNSDTALPTEKAVKTYVDSHGSNDIWTRTGTTITPTNAGDDLDISTAGHVIYSVDSVQSLVAATTIPSDNVIVPVTSTANVSLTSNPQIAAGTAGQVITIVGTNATYYQQLNHGNGLSMDNGQYFRLDENSTITFVYYNSLWLEISRSAAV